VETRETKNKTGGNGEQATDVWGTLKAAVKQMAESETKRTETALACMQALRACGDLFCADFQAMLESEQKRIQSEVFSPEGLAYIKEAEEVLAGAEGEMTERQKDNIERILKDFRGTLSCYQPWLGRRVLETLLSEQDEVERNYEQEQARQQAYDKLDNLIADLTAEQINDLTESVSHLRDCAKQLQEAAA